MDRQAILKSCLDAILLHPNEQKRNQSQTLLNLYWTAIKNAKARPIIEAKLNLIMDLRRGLLDQIEELKRK